MQISDSPTVCTPPVSFDFPLTSRRQGMTETCTVLTMYPSHQHYGVPGSAGQLVPGVVAKVVKEDGGLAKMGEVGELFVTGPQMALGYTNNENASPLIANMMNARVS